MSVRCYALIGTDGVPRGFWPDDAYPDVVVYGPDPNFISGPVEDPDAITGPAEVPEIELSRTRNPAVPADAVEIAVADWLAFLEDQAGHRFVDGKLTAYTPPPPIVDLAAYAKRRRDEAEAAGITIAGLAVASDPDSQTRVSNAYAGMQVTGAASIRFKASAGFVVLTLDQVKAVGSALFAHTQACFDAEGEALAGLSAGPPTITTTAEVDAVFAAVPTAY
ncbi:hypothetical protein MCBMB27_02644 [Methylobacterium phyllosphaerae]|uniref:DUF4376 domain-containing protein n=1 Tax=Methylobacterium phyllosphaerae TaxID=418223 RepID=A0AAE8HSH2_9HYPH|nr:DUF4376 domain-containing protein [Methylobacterium phyllosphaerae]APT31935.1 hypothetical protein MCBMB27_02644 [Methylobacterium phyllosphaerae]SFH01280.1 protein of unknown function [Methylobacterium phyllosphaerae]